MGLIERAIETAASAHRNQNRKGTDIPYITHPYAVGMILLGARCDASVVAAGILHDTLEDTELTEADLREQFGSRITELVKGCTEPDKSLPWEERKLHTIEAMRHASDEIRMIVCADKIHHVRSLAEDISRYGEEVWARFKRGREKQEWYIRELVRSMGDPGRMPLLQTLVYEVEFLFGPDKEGIVGKNSKS